MQRKEVALGRAAKADAGVGIVAKPKTLEERVAILEAQIALLVKTISGFNGERETRENITKPTANKDGIPFNTNLVGITKGQPYVLTVREDAYYVGITPYKTLSAAAKGVCGHRKSGWVFWKLLDGRTAKEAFGRK